MLWHKVYSSTINNQESMQEDRHNQLVQYYTRGVGSAVGRDDAGGTLWNSVHTHTNTIVFTHIVRCMRRGGQLPRSFPQLIAY